MATTIAVSGKGGSGKTTFSAMMMRSLLDQAPGKEVIEEVRAMESVEDIWYLELPELSDDSNE